MATRQVAGWRKRTGRRRPKWAVRGRRTPFSPGHKRRPPNGSRPRVQRTRETTIPRSQKMAITKKMGIPSRLVHRLESGSSSRSYAVVLIQSSLLWCRPEDFWGIPAILKYSHSNATHWPGIWPDSGRQFHQIRLFDCKKSISCTCWCVISTYINPQKDRNVNSLESLE